MGDSNKKLRLVPPPLPRGRPQVAAPATLDDSDDGDAEPKPTVCVDVGFLGDDVIELGDKDPTDPGVIRERVRRILSAAEADAETFQARVMQLLDTAIERSVIDDDKEGTGRTPGKKPPHVLRCEEIIVMITAEGPTRERRGQLGAALDHRISTLADAIVAEQQNISRVEREVIIPQRRGLESLRDAIKMAIIQDPQLIAILCSEYNLKNPPAGVRDFFLRLWRSPKMAVVYRRGGKFSAAKHLNDYQYEAALLRTERIRLLAPLFREHHVHGAPNVSFILPHGKFSKVITADNIELPLTQEEDEHPSDEKEYLAWTATAPALQAVNAIRKSFREMAVYETRLQKLRKTAQGIEAAKVRLAAIPPNKAPK